MNTRRLLATFLFVPLLAAAQETTLADAVRLLRQATFGPTEADVARVMAIGAPAWVDEQFSLPATSYPAYPYVSAVRLPTCVDNRTPPLTATSYCARDNYSLFQLQRQFFTDAIVGRDQLRQRVAFALSQIFVTSGVANARNYAMRNYQQIFRDHAFGTYADVLHAVTLSPEMGDYLDMVNNNRADPVAKTQPNENYGREILQLFSIGTVVLAADGTPQYDADGRPVPSYDQDVIEGFAHVFTGWTYPTIPGNRARNNNPRNYEGDMIPVDVNHDFSAKTLLGGVQAPAGLSMRADLDFALGNIVAHPNVGPFIGRQLIQKLVASDPSPAYVARVAAVFANNGAGQRGDLKAVVRAILLDPEARGARTGDARDGKLAEPILYLTAMARAFGGQTDGVYFRGASSLLSQFIFYAPSVFNYYPPGYIVPGTDLNGPEFGVQTTATAISRANLAYSLIFSGTIAPDPTVFGATGTTITLAPYQAVASDAEALVDRFDQQLFAGSMPQAMKSAIVTAVKAVPSADTLTRARTAAYLVITSPQYQVEH
jgi:uncharacterized protein (DUF1800 family)